MKTIGLLGGMSWESTVTYYQEINRGVQAHWGGLSSAKVLLSSVDFAEVAALQTSGDWPTLGWRLAQEARRLEQGGADFILICTNTMHVVYDEVAGQVGVPVVHIADPTAEAAQALGIGTLGLLGTRYTMERPFYRQRLEERGLRVLVPEAEDRERMHRIIFDELCQGRLLDASRAQVLGMIERLAQRGAQGVVLGCTEIGLLVEGAGLPLLDTAVLHARKAVELAAGNGGLQ